MVIVLFIIMLIGVLLDRLKILNEHSKSSISSLILNISLPMQIVAASNMEFGKEAKNESMWLVIIAVIIFFVSILIAELLFKKRVSKFALVFPNAGYMGLPVLNSLLGPQGLFMGAIFQLVFHAFTWTYGISLFTKSEKFTDSLKKMVNPSLFAVLLSIVMMSTNIMLPTTIRTVFEMMGSLTTPLSMLLIGSTLSQVNFKSMLKNKQIYIITFVRLLVLPALVLLFLLFPGIPRMSIYIAFIINAMPTAAITGILSMKYGADEKLASAAVAFTTLISVFTIFLITDVIDLGSILLN